MRRLLITTLLLVTMLSLGQVSINRRSAFFKGALRASGPPGPDSIPNLYVWWVASDIPSNVIVSNQWLDRIQGLHAWQMDTSKSPTNSSLGVRFDGSQVLTNIGFGLADGSPAMGSLGTYVLLFRIDSKTPSQYILSDGLSGGIAINGSQKLKWFSGGGTQNDPVDPPTATNIDYVVATYLNNLVTYTNGALLITNTVVGTFNFEQKVLGGISSAISPMKGYIVEAIFYTNVLSAANVTTLHTYFSNTYSLYP